MDTNAVVVFPARRAYLDDLENYEHSGAGGSTDEHFERRREVQRARYGFDERQTWSLDHTMVELLYERLKMFQALGEWKHTDGSIVEFEGEEITKRWAIDELLLLGKTVLTEHLNTAKRDAAAARLWKLWAVVHPWMWS